MERYRESMFAVGSIITNLEDQVAQGQAGEARKDLGSDTCTEK
jgi:hypothetical protein